MYIYRFVLTYHANAPWKRPIVRSISTKELMVLELK